MAGTSNVHNTGVMHWLVAPGRVACNSPRAIMGVPYEAFWDDPRPCKRCLSKALAAKSKAEQVSA